MTDEGIYTNEGSKTFLANKAEKLKDDWKFKWILRQFPNEVRDAFRDESDNCAFNLVKY
jgi:hypothetical protein